MHERQILQLATSFLGGTFLTTKQERLQENNHTIKVSKVIVVTNIKRKRICSFPDHAKKQIPSLVITLAHFYCKEETKILSQPTMI